MRNPETNYNVRFDIPYLFFFNVPCFNLYYSFVEKNSKMRCHHAFPYHFCPSWQVVVLQVNGVAQPADSLHVLCIGRLRMRLARGKAVVAKEFYSSLMQVFCRNHFQHLKCIEQLTSGSLIVGCWYCEA
jgi:hypothetical protein